MAGQGLDNFLTEKTSSEMQRIEEEIRAEVEEKICCYFGVPSTDELNEGQIREVREAEASRKKGFIKLGYNLVLRELGARP